jgi:GMP synthase (glutamine-hydrolysing)
MTGEQDVLVIDLHIDDPSFAGPRWFPEGMAYEVCRVTRGESPVTPERWSHVVISGSSLSILAHPEWMPEVEAFLQAAGARNVPVMGVCYGSQLLARVFFGMDHVRLNPGGVEVGWLPVDVVDEAEGWFDGLPRPFSTWHFHYDEVHDLPAGCRVLARSDGCDVQAWDHPGMRLFGTQFHPEMEPEAGNACYRKEAEKLATHGIDPEDLVAATRDDGARILFTRFLSKAW